VELPALFEAVRVTVYVPAVVYVCTGFCCRVVYPSPKDQTHALGLFVEVSMNWTENGVVPEVLIAEKDATGVVDAGLTVIYAAFESVLLPAEFVDVSVTVNIPVVV